MAGRAIDHELIQAVASEMCAGIHRAVGIWMLQIEDALDDPQLTTLGRLRAVQEVLQRFHAIEQPGARRDGYAA